MRLLRSVLNKKLRRKHDCVAIDVSTDGSGDETERDLRFHSRQRNLAGVDASGLDQPGRVGSTRIGLPSRYASAFSMHCAKNTRYTSTTL